jgi:hypothetical protein
MPNPQKWLKDHKRFTFDTLTPAKWMFSAIALKESAPLIDWEDDLPTQSLGLIFVRRMLIGMSIENLLKGLLMAQGEIMVADGKLSSRFKSHTLPQFAKGPTCVTITAGEHRLMAELKNYIVWAGRYPIPLKSDDVIPLYYSPEIYEAEITLLKKLLDKLIAVGWDTRYDGTRVPLKQLVRT